MDVISQKWDHGDSDGSLSVEDSGQAVLIELSAEGHDEHADSDHDDSVSVNDLPAVLVSQIPEQWGSNHLGDDIEGDDKGVGLTV